VERFKGNDLMAVNPLFSEATAFGVLNNFLSEFHNDNGYALPSRYEVIITPPPKHPNPNAAKKVDMRVEALDMPGRALNTSPDSNMYGIAPEIVDGITFAGQISLTIQTSSDLEERVFFESWQELAWDRSTWNVGYYKDYIGTMDIYVLDINNNRRYGVRIFECFPKEVGPIPLDYAKATEIIKTPVTMEYKYWETLNINNQPPSLLDKVFDTVITGAERSINANIPKVLSRLL
jgi:hypothetical protein